MKRGCIRASIFAVLWVAALAPRAAAETVKISGYLEFLKGQTAIVDGQRIQVTAKTKLRSDRRARTVADLPLGYEVKVKGTRQADGTVLAKTFEGNANGMAMFEADVLAATDAAEQSYVKAAKVFDKGPDGKEQVLGQLHSDGPQVERARKIVDRLLPPYVDPSKVRVYVVDNKEWNAMAMANRSIYVFSGLMADLNDDELAVVLGHEITHATHEHSRRQATKSLYGGIFGSLAAAGAELIDDPVARAAAQTATAVGVTTFSNVYSRDYEDQADRVGLRYVYEAGYDYTQAPALWRRFAKKYGDGDKVSNFFFGDHSLSAARAAALEREIANNYRDPAHDPPTHAAHRSN